MKVVLKKYLRSHQSGTAGMKLALNIQGKALSATSLGSLLRTYAELSLRQRGSAKMII